MKGDFWRRLRLPWLDRADIESEVDDELTFHMEMRERELVDSGVDPEEARRRAHRDFGDIDETRRRYVTRRGRDLRRLRITTWAAELAQDLRFGARSLRKRPAFAATAILVLGLGIGAPTTVFTLVRTIFFERPEHVVEPHRLVRVFRSWAPGAGGGTLQHPDYRYYRDNARTFAGLAGYGGDGAASYRIGPDAPGQLELLHVSDNYFDVLGVSPRLGRTFLPEEDAVPGAEAVAVVSHGFWTRALGGSADVVGSEIVLNGIPFTVVGVAPEGFTGITPVEPAPDVWVPLAMFGTLRRFDPANSAWWERRPQNVSRWLDVVGRVADGVTVEAARSELVALADALEDPHKGDQESVMVTRQFLYRPGEEASLTSLSTVLLTVVGIVLLVAASNVAVLLLSRATTRYREIGIRTAIGAGRGRIVRQLVAESVLLGALGGALGVALAFLFSETAGSLLPLAFESAFVPDARVLAAAAGLTLLTSLVVGLAPAIHSVRRDVASVIEHGGAASAEPAGGGGFGRFRWAGGLASGGGILSAGGVRARDVLVVSQVALSLVLVAGAFLFARSFEAASEEELGFEHESVLVTRVDLQSLGYAPDEGRVFLDDALERLEAIPGVRSASTTNRVPFGGDWSTEIPAPDGATPNAPDGRVVIGLNAVGPSYFDLMGIEIVSGRGITGADRADAEPVVVVNETLAELLWPGVDPVGRILPELSRPYRVVGVARDATYYELGEEPWTQAYFSVQQAYQRMVHFIVRTEGDASELAGPTQSALRALDPDLAFATTTTLAAVVDEQLARYEVSAILVGLFGFIALILATAGLYGVVAFTVSRRTREIGVRMALGADRLRVARSVLRSGLGLAGVGVALGLAGAVALRRFTGALLYGVEPTDPLPLVASSLALLAVAAAASLVPAGKATRVDPVQAIRTE